MVGLVIILGLICIILLIFSVIQFKTRLKHQRVLVQMMYRAQRALDVMRRLDLRGAFQAHDQVGEAFMMMTVTIEQLRNYFASKLNEEKTE